MNLIPPLKVQLEVDGERDIRVVNIYDANGVSVHNVIWEEVDWDDPEDDDDWEDEDDSYDDDDDDTPAVTATGPRPYAVGFLPEDDDEVDDGPTGFTQQGVRVAPGAPQYQVAVQEPVAVARPVERDVDELTTGPTGFLQDPVTFGQAVVNFANRVESIGDDLTTGPSGFLP